MYIRKLFPIFIIILSITIYTYRQAITCVISKYNGQYTIRWALGFYCNRFDIVCVCV